MTQKSPTVSINGPSAEAVSDFDVLLVGGQVVDGSGAPPRRADVGITGDRISLVGEAGAASARRTIELAGKAVAPGVIDIHTHADFTLLEEPLGRWSLRQGITTEVVGNCGQSYAPITEHNAETIVQRSLSWQPSVTVDWRSVGDYLERVSGRNGLNCYFLVGHNAIRTAVIGFDEREATSDEIRQMASMLEQAMDEGAGGMSLGLEYPPARAVSVEEQAVLAAVVGQRNGLLGCHMKNRDIHFKSSLEEILTACSSTGVRLQLSHFTAKPGAVNGAWQAALERVESERLAGLDVAMDVYPYDTGPGFATAFLPDWALEGGPAKMLRRLRDRATREKLRLDYDRYWRFLGTGEWHRLSLAYSSAHPEWIGQSFDRLAKQLGAEPIDVLLQLFEDEGTGLSRVTVNGRLFEEEYVQECMRHSLFALASDGWRPIRDGGPGEVAHHPNCYGWVPKILGEYVREKSVLPLEVAIWKMTGYPAERLGLSDRGLVRQGYMADLFVFDPAAVSTGATYAEPAALPVGISEVFVNGELSISAGEPTGAAAGRIIR